jgi:NADH:ubiquinone reductase (H+-translocating)
MREICRCHRIPRIPPYSHFGWIQLRGALAWWLWGFAHIYFLIGVRNRLSVALNWLWIYARDQRSARLITRQGEAEGPPRQM